MLLWADAVSKAVVTFLSPFFSFVFPFCLHLLQSEKLTKREAEAKFCNFSLSANCVSVHLVYEPSVKNIQHTCSTCEKFAFKALCQTGSLRYGCSVSAAVFELTRWSCSEPELVVLLSTKLLLKTEKRAFWQKVMEGKVSRELMLSHTDISPHLSLSVADSVQVHRTEGESAGPGAAAVITYQAKNCRYPAGQAGSQGPGGAHCASAQTWS